jgi:tRNA threonylcarbamoyladenosine biosynthesis protein TsaB
LFILRIETATKTCSVALHQEKAFLGVQEVHLEKSHSSLLQVMIADLLRQCGVNKKQLSAIAVSKGPGSYTGLRIGVSAAKGLCFALDIPLIAVETLEAMAWGVHQYTTENTGLCPMIDARRMEVYCQLWNENVDLVLPTSAVIVDEEAFQKHLSKHPILFFGDGASKCIPILGKAPHARFLHHVHPSATWIGALAFEKYTRKAFEDVAYFEPYYLKDFRIAPPKKKS